MDLSGNSIGIAGAKALSEALTNNRSLISLSLGGNNVNERAAEVKALYRLASKNKDRIVQAVGGVVRNSKKLISAGELKLQEAADWRARDRSPGREQEWQARRHCPARAPNASVPLGHMEVTGPPLFACF